MDSKHTNAIVVSDLIGTRKYKFEDYHISFAKYDKDEGIILATVMKVASAKQRPGAFYNVRIQYEPKGPITTQSKVKVSCSCPDFLTTFSYVLSKHNALFNQTYASLSNEFTYAISTPPNKRNTFQHVGACKHILMVIEAAFRIS